MTIALLAGGAILAVLGTRVCAIVLAAAAVASATSGAPSAAAGTWIAASAAGLVLVGVAPRRLVLPIVGAAAVIVSSGANNAAAFLPAWTLGTVTAVTAVRGETDDRRWALGMLLADMPVVLAVLWTILRGGFVSWPPAVAEGPAVLLVVAALLRSVVIGAAPDGRAEPALLIGRAQVFVLVVLAMPAATRPTGAELDLAAAVLTAAAVVIAAGGFLPRAASRDGFQEVGLVAATAAASLAGWTPPGWTWGAMAAGTLLHVVRASPFRQGARTSAVVAIVRGGALGTPLWPVAMALLIGSAAAGGVLGATVLVGVALGLGGRAWWGGPRRERRRPVAPVLAPVALAAVAAGVVAPLLSEPSALAGERVPWPGLGALALLFAGAAVGALVGDRFPAARIRGPSVLPAVDLGQGRALAIADRRGGVFAPMAALALAAIGVWVTGWLRGFL